MDLHRLRVVEFDTLVSEKEDDKKYAAELEEHKQEDCNTSSDDKKNETNETGIVKNCLGDNRSPLGPSQKCLVDKMSLPGTSKKWQDDRLSPPRTSKKCIGDTTSPPGTSKKFIGGRRSPPGTSKKCIGDTLLPEGTSKECIGDTSSSLGTSKKSTFIKRKSKSEIFRIPTKSKPRKRELKNNSSVVDLTKLFQDSAHPQQKKRTLNLFNRKSRVDQKVKHVKEKNEEFNFLFARETPSFIRYCEKRAENIGKGTKKKRDSKSNDIFGFQKNNRYIDPYLYQMSCNYLNTDKLRFKKIRKGFHRKPKQPPPVPINCSCKHHAMRILNSGGNGEPPSIYYNLNTHHHPRRSHRKRNYDHEEALLRDRAYNMAKDETVEVSPSSLSPITRCCCDACTGPSKAELTTRSHRGAPNTREASPAHQMLPCKCNRKSCPKHSTPSPSTAGSAPAQNKPHAVARKKRHGKTKKKKIAASNQRNRLFTGCFQNVSAFHIKLPSGKNCIKYAFFGLLIVVWSPCLLAVVLAWVIMCPVKITNILKTDTSKKAFPMMNSFMNRFRKKGPECEYQRMCFENCLPVTNRSFMTSLANWYSRAVGTVVNSFNAMISMLKLKNKSPTCAGSSFLTSTHPNPRKRYTLFYANNRGWMMKPSRRSNTRSCASTRVVQNMRCEFRPTFWRKSTCNEKCQTKIRSPCQKLSYECPVHGTKCVPSYPRHKSSPAGDACPNVMNQVPGCICDEYSRNKMQSSSMFMPVASHRLQRQQVNIPSMFPYPTSGTATNSTEYQTVNTNPINFNSNEIVDKSNKDFTKDSLSQRKNGTLPFGVVFNCPCGTKHPIITNLETFRSHKFGLAGKSLNMSTKYTPSLVVKGLQEQFAKYWTKHEASNTGKKSLGAHRITGLTDITSKYSPNCKSNGLQKHTTECEIALKCPFRTNNKSVITDKKLPTNRKKHCIRNKCVLADISQSALTTHAHTSTYKINHAHKKQNTSKHTPYNNINKTQSAKPDIALNCPCGAKHEQPKQAYKYKPDKTHVPTQKQLSPVNIKASNKPDKALNCPCGNKRCACKFKPDKILIPKEKQPSPADINAGNKLDKALDCPCGNKRCACKYKPDTILIPKEKQKNQPSECACKYKPDKPLVSTQKLPSPVRIKASPKPDIALNCPCGVKHQPSECACKYKLDKPLVPTQKLPSPVRIKASPKPDIALNCPCGVKHQPSECACKYKLDKPLVPTQKQTSPVNIKASPKPDIALNCPCGAKKQPPERPRQPVLTQKQPCTADIATCTKPDIALNCPCGANVQPSECACKYKLDKTLSPTRKQASPADIKASTKPDIALNCPCGAKHETSKQAYKYKPDNNIVPTCKQPTPADIKGSSKSDMALTCACRDKHELSKQTYKYKTDKNLIPTQSTADITTSTKRDIALNCPCGVKPSTADKGTICTRKQPSTSDKDTICTQSFPKKQEMAIQKQAATTVKASQCACKSDTSATKEKVSPKQTVSQKETIDCACGPGKLPSKPAAEPPSKHQSSQCECKSKASKTKETAPLKQTVSLRKTIDCACGADKLPSKPAAEPPSKHQSSQCECKSQASNMKETVPPKQTVSQKKTIDCACGSDKLPSKPIADASTSYEKMAPPIQIVSQKKTTDCECGSDKLTSKPVADACTSYEKTAPPIQTVPQTKRTDCGCGSDKLTSKPVADASTSFEKTAAPKQSASSKATECGCKFEESKKLICPCADVMPPGRYKDEVKTEHVHEQSISKEIIECRCWPKPKSSATAAKFSSKRQGNENLGLLAKDNKTQNESLSSSSEEQSFIAKNCPCRAKRQPSIDDCKTQQQMRLIQSNRIYDHTYNTDLAQYPSNQQVTAFQTWAATQCHSKYAQSTTDSEVVHSKTPISYKTAVDCGWGTENNSNIIILANKTENKPSKQSLSKKSPTVGKVSECGCPSENTSTIAAKKTKHQTSLSDISSKHPSGQQVGSPPPPKGKASQCGCPSEKRSTKTMKKTGLPNKSSRHLLSQQVIRAPSTLSQPQTEELIKQVSTQQANSPLYGIAANCPCGVKRQQILIDKEAKQAATDNKRTQKTSFAKVEPPVQQPNLTDTQPQTLQEQSNSFGIASDCTCNKNQTIATGKKSLYKNETSLAGYPPSPPIKFPQTQSTSKEQSQALGITSIHQPSRTREAGLGENPLSNHKKIQPPTLGIASDCVCQKNDLVVEAAKKSLQKSDLGAQTSNQLMNAYQTQSHIDSSKTRLGEHLSSHRVKFSQIPSYTSQSGTAEKSVLAEQQLRQQTSRFLQVPSNTSQKQSTALDPHQTVLPKHPLGQSKKTQTPKKLSLSKLASKGLSSTTYKKSHPSHGEKATQSKFLGFRPLSSSHSYLRRSLDKALSKVKYTKTAMKKSYGNQISTTSSQNKLEPRNSVIVDKTRLTRRPSVYPKSLEYSPSQNSLLHTECTCSVESLVPVVKTSQRARKPVFGDKSRSKVLGHNDQQSKTSKHQASLAKEECPCSRKKHIKISFSESEESDVPVFHKITRHASTQSCKRTECTCSIDQPSSQLQSSIISRHSSKVSRLVMKLRSKLLSKISQISQQSKLPNNKPTPKYSNTSKKNPRSVVVSSSQLKHKQVDKSHEMFVQYGSQHKSHERFLQPGGQQSKTSQRSTFSSHINHTKCHCPVDDTSLSKPNKTSPHTRKSRLVDKLNLSFSRRTQMSITPRYPSLPIYSSHSMIHSKCCCHKASSKLSSAETSRYIRKPLHINKSYSCLSTCSKGRISKTSPRSSFPTHSSELECRCHVDNTLSLQLSKKSRPRVSQRTVNQQSNISESIQYSSIVPSTIPTKSQCTCNETFTSSNVGIPHHFFKTPFKRKSHPKPQHLPSQQQTLSQFSTHLNRSDETRAQKVLNNFQSSSNKLNSRRYIEQQTILTQYPSPVDQPATQPKFQQQLSSTQPDIPKVNSFHRRSQLEQSEKQGRSEIIPQQPHKIQQDKISQPQRYPSTKYIIPRPPYPPDASHPIIPIIPGMCRCATKQRIKTEYLRKTGLNNKLQHNMDSQNLLSEQSHSRPQYLPSQRHTMSQFSSLFNRSQETPSPHKHDSYRHLRQQTILTQYPSPVDNYQPTSKANETVPPQHHLSQEPLMSKRSSSFNRPQSKPFTDKLRSITDKISIHSHKNKQEKILASLEVQTAPIIPGKCACLSEKLHQLSDKLSQYSRKSVLEKSLPPGSSTRLPSSQPRKPDSNRHKSKLSTEAQAGYPQQLPIQQPTVSKQPRQYSSQTTPLTDNNQDLTSNPTTRRTAIGTSRPPELLQHVPSKQPEISKQSPDYNLQPTSSTDNQELSSDPETPLTRRNTIGTQRSPELLQDVPSKQSGISKQSHQSTSQPTSSSDNQGLTSDSESPLPVKTTIGTEIPSKLSQHHSSAQPDITKVDSPYRRPSPNQLTEKLRKQSDKITQQPSKTEFSQLNEHSTIPIIPGTCRCKEKKLQPNIDSQDLPSQPVKSKHSPIVHGLPIPLTDNQRGLSPTLSHHPRKTNMGTEGPPEFPHHLSNQKSATKNLISQPTPTVDKQGHLSKRDSHLSRKTTMGTQKSEFPQHLSSQQPKHSKPSAAEQRLISDSVPQHSQKPLGTDTQGGLPHHLSSQQLKKSKYSRHFSSRPTPLVDKQRQGLGTEVQSGHPQHHSSLPPVIPQSAPPLDNLQPNHIIPGKCACSTNIQGNAQEVVPPVPTANFQKSHLISGVCTGYAKKKRLSRVNETKYSNKIGLTEKRIGRQHIIIQRSELLQSPQVPQDPQNPQNLKTAQNPRNAQYPKNAKIPQNAQDPQNPQKQPSPFNLQSLKAAIPPKLLAALQRNSCECPPEQPQISPEGPEKTSHVPRKSAPVDKPPPGLLQRYSSGHGRKTSADDGVQQQYSQPAKQQLPYPDFNRVSMRYPGHMSPRKHSGFSGPNRSEHIPPPANYYYPPAPGVTPPPNYARYPCYINPANKCGPKSCYDEYALRRAYKRRPLRYIPPRQQLPKVAMLKQKKKKKESKKKKKQVPQNKLTACCQCVRELVNKAEKEAWPTDVSCRPMWIHALKRRPCFWIYEYWPSIYPIFLSCYKFQQNICQMFMYLISICFWCPLIFCVYLCCDVICQGC